MTRKPVGPQKPTVPAAPRSLWRAIAGNQHRPPDTPDADPWGRRQQADGLGGLGPSLAWYLSWDQHPCPPASSPMGLPHPPPAQTWALWGRGPCWMYQVSFWYKARKTWHRDSEKRPALAAPAAESCRQLLHTGLKKHHLTFSGSLNFRILSGGGVRVDGAEGVERCIQRETSRDMRASGE